MTTSFDFDLQLCSRPNKESFSIAELRNIWKELRSLYSLKTLHNLEGCSKEVVGEKCQMTLGEFAVHQLHFKSHRKEDVTTIKIPREEWFSLIQEAQNLEKKRHDGPKDNKEVVPRKQDEEKEYEIYFSEEDDEEEPKKNNELKQESEIDTDTSSKEQPTQEEIIKTKKKKLTAEEKKMRRRHARRLREGLNASAEFPCLSLAQMRLFLGMIRQLTTFPMKFVVGMHDNKPLTLETFAIRYVCAEQFKRYQLRFE
jgi:hypothetical protein